MTAGPANASAVRKPRLPPVSPCWAAATVRSVSDAGWPIVSVTVGRVMALNLAAKNFAAKNSAAMNFGATCFAEQLLQNVA